MAAMKHTVLSVVVALVLLAPLRAMAGEVRLFGLGGGNTGSYAVRVASLKEAKFRTTVRQQYDFSCGSAALATLLTYHYSDPVTEAQAFRYMYERGDQAKIQREGFSLLDIKSYLESHGYMADGFETTLDKLETVGVPAIVLIDEGGYYHFVVIKGLQGPEVLVGDPSHGTRFIQRARFEEMWVNRIVFVITSHQEAATFNAPSDWKSGKAPLGVAVSRESLGNLMILVRGPNDF
jgi:predicted double-glycine peptidase